MNIEFREADYAQVLAEIALVRSEALPDMPIAIEELEEQLRLRPPGLFRHLELIYAEGELAGFWMLQQEPMFVSPQEMHLRMLLRPSSLNHGIETAAIERGIGLAKQQGLSKVVALARSTHPGFTNALIESEFEAFHRDIISRLVLDEFEETLWQSAIDRIATDGIQIKSVSQLELDNPGWIEQAYHVHVELMKDVPFASTYTAPAFETWASKVRNPKLFDMDLMFYAFDGPRIVGETALFRFENKPEFCLTGLTAVVKDYRRQGIALALKVWSIGVAKSLGVVHIDTGNEEDNPAYQMNVKLGYRDLYDDIGYELILQSDAF